MKKYRSIAAIFMAILMVCLMCGTAFAAENDAADEDIVDAQEVIADAEADAEAAAAAEAAANEEAPQEAGRQINSAALKNVFWALGVIAIGLVLVVVANKKSGKGKKKNSDK